METPKFAISINPPQTEVLVAGAQSQLELVQSLVITDDGTYQMAGTELAAIKGKRNRLEEQRKGLTKPLDELKSKIMDLFRQPIALLDQAEAALKGAMLTYSTEQERQAAEARRQAEETARKERERLEREAREAREKAEAEARRQREEEARRKAEAERAQREAEEARRREEEAKRRGDEEAARKARDEAAHLERERREQEAAARKAASKADSATQQGEAKAEELTTQSQLVSAAPVAIAPAKAAGTSTRKKWKARVTDKAALVKYIAAHPQFLHVLEVNESALNKLAGAMEENLNIDGCQVYQEAILAAKAA